MDIAVLIPAYNPNEMLVSFVSQLSRGNVSPIIIVDDGSAQEHGWVFERIVEHPNVILLKHTCNLGKGAALKSGMRYFHNHQKRCSGIVTADADGQHLANDVLRVADVLRASPRCLILGSRNFAGKVPGRSLFGNTLTRYITQFLIGITTPDTQTGLRGIPAHFIPVLLNIRANGYEFEMEMLFKSKQAGINIIDVPIETIYIAGNKSSHFRPVLDSAKIAYVMIRYIFNLF